MKIARQFLLVTALSALLGACSRAPSPEAPQTKTEQPSALKLSGTVTDAASHPVAGARVEYWSYEGNSLNRGAPELEKRTTTGADGAFEFHVRRNTGFLLARKPGLAPAWRQLGQPFNMAGATNKLVLTPPGTLSGIVVDESNRPVANVEVFVAMAFDEITLENGARTFNYLAGKAARESFSARTDAAGRFGIENFPTNAAALFAVHSPGKVLRPPEQQSMNIETAGYRAGEAEIKLVTESAGSIEGKIIGGKTDQPPPVARLMLQSDEGNIFLRSGHEPVQSGADGVFRFDDVAAGAYHVRAVFGTNASSIWVAEAVPVSVESGQVTRGVQVTAQRGALLEVTVLGAEDRKPVSQVNVNAYRENFQAAAVTGSNGIARLRLIPGDYQISAYRPPTTSSQTSAAVEAGVTNRVEIDIVGPQKITGIVRGPDGRPAAGVMVRMVGAFAPAQREVKTDVNGKFELEWNQRQIGMNNSTPCLLVRDAEHNLAAAQDIDEDTSNVDLKLTPGLTLAGRAECNGKPITNATAAIIFWTGNSGMWLQGLARINTPSPGRFEIPALPPGRQYGVVISAPDYGQDQITDVGASGEPGRQELGPVELKPANLKLAGQVLDMDNKPVAGCYVNLSGEGQPNANVRTDRRGRFTFEHVCEGPVRLYANSQRSYGNISAEGGDTNVVLQLGQTYSPGATMHKLKGTVTAPDGKPVASAQVAVFPRNGEGWFRTGAKGEYHLSWSLQSWQIQNGGPLLVGRDPARNLAGSEDLSEDATNLDLQLKPALTFAGRVESVDGSPLADAQVGVWLRAGNTFEQLNNQLASTDTQGRYEIKCLPPDASYLVYAQAPGHGRSQQQIQNDTETNHLELEPFVLKLANRYIAGRVLNEDDKPAFGVNVSISGDGQPQGNMTTDGQGRFHFKVCEGQIRLFAYSQYGGGNAQVTVNAGDTNIVMNLMSSSGGFPQPHRVSLKGSPLPDLTTVNLPADAAPTGQPVLLCLFDASQRPSRHVIGQLNEQAAALHQKHIAVLGIQVRAISDDNFNAWKNGSAVSISIGCVTDKSEKTKWASDVPALPWLILTDAGHRVVAEGFSPDELDAQIQKLAK